MMMMIVWVLKSDGMRIKAEREREREGGGEYFAMMYQTGEQFVCKNKTTSDPVERSSRMKNYKTTQLTTSRGEEEEETDNEGFKSGRDIVCRTVTLAQSVDAVCPPFSIRPKHTDSEIDSQPKSNQLELNESESSFDLLI
jgi:hypothetical protein